MRQISSMPSIGKPFARYPSMSCFVLGSKFYRNSTQKDFALGSVIRAFRRRVLFSFTIKKDHNGAHFDDCIRSRFLCIAKKLPGCLVVVVVTKALAIGFLLHRRPCYFGPHPTGRLIRNTLNLAGRFLNEYPCFWKTIAVVLLKRKRSRATTQYKAREQDQGEKRKVRASLGTYKDSLCSF